MKKIIDEFPILDVSIRNEPLIYLDNAATTLKPRSVINSINKYYHDFSANVHRSVYRIADKATYEYELSREKVAQFINAESSKSIIFTSGATESINLVAYSLGEILLTKNDEVLITEMEHHSNNVPWQRITQKTGAKLKYIPVNLDGTLDLDNIDTLLNNKTKLVSIIHQSNVFGTINPIEEIIEKAHNLDALVLVDVAQSIPHKKIDVVKMDCDFLVFSGHKMLGPTGVGVLYGREDILMKMEPFLSGGEMISSVSMDSVSYNELPWKFEAGTPKIAQVIGLGAAIDFINSIGIENINSKCKELRNYAFSELEKIEEMIIYGNNQNKGPVISFNIRRINSHDLAQLLDQFNICIRSGNHCSEPIMRKLSVSSVARISLYFYNSLKEIDKLIVGIKKASKLLL